MGGLLSEREAPAPASEPLAEANEPEREREEQDGETEIGDVHGDARERRRRALKNR
jgi:hypothetical protein